MTSSPTEQPERVTVVVPVYNRAGTLLSNALDSVLSQDYPNLDVLAIDDGSTDKTPDALADYASRHPDRFRWHRQENQGQAATLNRGYEMAEGNLLAYLSSDDVLLDGAISRLAAELERNPHAVLAYPAYQVIDKAGEVVDTITPPEYSRVESVRLQDTIIGPGALFRADALRRAGGLRTDLRYLADKELWLRLNRVGPFVRVPEPLACWRRHGGALTVAEQGREMAEERLSILDSVFANEPEPELVAIRDQAYRNALVLSATVIAPGFNDPGERYFVVDRHGREVSASAGAETTEERLASARDQLAAQRQRIAELQREKETLLKRRPLVRFMADRLRRRRTGAGS
jgi:Glycosyl transferase family 2